MSTNARPATLEEIQISMNAVLENIAERVKRRMQIKQQMKDDAALWREQLKDVDGHIEELSNQRDMLIAQIQTGEFEASIKLPNYSGNRESEPSNPGTQV